MSEREQFHRIQPGAQSTLVPIGAVLTVGRRRPGSSGAPVDTDRFWIVQPRPTDEQFNRGAGGKYTAKYRPLHPAFAAWNVEDGGGRKLPRNQIDCMIVTSDRDDCFRQHFRCQSLADGPQPGEVPGGGSWEAPPNYAPACTGDGCHASRFQGIADGKPAYARIRCRGELCAFRQKPDPRCKRYTELIFQPAWPDDASGLLPVMLMKWTSQGEASASAAAGLFEHTERVAASAGVTVRSWFGFRFRLSVSMATNPERRRRWPVVTATPLDDFAGWLVSQRQMLQAAGAQPIALPPATAEEEDMEAAMLGAEPPDITITVPGQLALPVNAEPEERL